MASCGSASDCQLREIKIAAVFAPIIAMIGVCGVAGPSPVMRWNADKKSPNETQICLICRRWTQLGEGGSSGRGPASVETPTPGQAPA